MFATYHYSVGGFTFRLLLPPQQDADALLPSFRAFRREPSMGEPMLFTFTAGVEPPFPMPRERLLEETLDEQGQVSLWRVGCGFSMEVCPAYGTPSHVLYAMADFVRVWATLHWDAPAVGSVLGFMLRMTYAQAVQPHGAVLVHAAAVTLGGMAYLFMGRSGTGKSTHARLWMRCFRKCQLLNDDTPVLRLQDGQVWAYGTPWSGKTPCYRPLRFPVRGIVRLFQASRNRFIPCQDVEAFNTLLPGCSAIRSRSWFYQRMADTLAQVAMLVTVGQLECLPNDDAAKICAAGLA